MSALIRNLPLVIIIASFAVLLAIILQIVTTFPPRSFTILTGSEEGGYYLAAQEYQRIAKEKGFDVVIRTTNGAVETLELLEAGEAEVGFIQSGIDSGDARTELSTLANVFYEPVWIFYRTDAFDGESLTRLPQAAGKRIAIGPEGSGTHLLSNNILRQAGVISDTASLLPLSFADAAEQLVAGTVDVAIFVVSDSADLPWDLIRQPGIELMNVERAAAYAFYYPTLSELVLPAGGADVEQSIPSEPKTMLATVANLVVRNDIHPDLIRLLVVAAFETHRQGGRFEKAGEFPNTFHTDLPVNSQAEAYMRQIQQGGSFLDTYFPFWLAAVLDRYMLFVLPALLLLLPILSRSPQAFQWYMRQSVVRWYRIVHELDRRSQTMTLDEIDAALQELDELDHRIGDELIVTNTVMPQVYELRQHIDFVVEKLNKRREALIRQTQAQPSPAA
jgi:TRAP transporter TAXI family solute receptor